MTRRRGGISGIGAKVQRPRRDWSLVNEKLEAEGFECRSCHRRAGEAVIERAHIIGREHDFEPPVTWPSDVPWITRRRVLVVPARIVPLCGPVGDPASCHGKAHMHALEWLPILTVAEQVQAVADAGGIETALRTLVGAYPPEAVESGLYDDGINPTLDIPI